MRKIQVVKSKDRQTIESEKKNDSKSIKTPRITLSTWLSESLNNINERKQMETSAFFN
jgi:hypothetical protein